MATQVYMLFLKSMENGVTVGIYSTLEKAEKHAERFISKYNASQSKEESEGKRSRGQLRANDERWFYFKYGKMCAQWTSSWDALYILRCDMDVSAKCNFETL